MGILSRLFGRGAGRSAKRTTLSNPFRIEDPIAGFACMSPEYSRLVAEDSKALRGLFKQCRFSHGEPVTCNVLFIYCGVSSDGVVVPSGQRVRDIVWAAGAHIAVVAVGNQSDHYLKALGSKSNWPVNIVLTTNRGEHFAPFFVRLFTLMLSGKTMPMAWVELVPQGPGPWHDKVPGAVFVAEAGHVTFCARASLGRRLPGAA